MPPVPLTARKFALISSLTDHSFTLPRLASADQKGIRPLIKLSWMPFRTLLSTSSDSAFDASSSSVAIQPEWGVRGAVTASDGLRFLKLLGVGRVHGDDPKWARCWDRRLRAGKPDRRPGQAKPTMDCDFA